MPKYLVAVLTVGHIQRLQHAPKRGPPIAVLGRKIGATKKRLTLGSQKDRQRPATVLAQQLQRMLIDLVDVGMLLAVDLDVDKVLVHQRRRLSTLEGFVRHHMTPVTRRVANRQQDRLVLFPRLRKRLFAPRIPIDRIVLMLTEVRAGLKL